jgi:hypothetical protein
VGNPAIRHEGVLLKAVKDYLGMSYDRKRSYSVTDAAIDAKVIPYGYLRRRLRAVGDFSKDRRGLKRAVDEAIADALSIEQLVELSRDQMATLNLGRSRAFVLGDAFK